MTGTRPAREAVATWNRAYAQQTAALFAATRSPAGDIEPIHRLAVAYRTVAQAWRELSADLAAPLWSRHAASVAAEEFDRRAVLEEQRAFAMGDANTEPLCLAPGPRHARRDQDDGQTTCGSQE
jgi:hypothetical protein